MMPLSIILEVGFAVGALALLMTGFCAGRSFERFVAKHK